MTILNVGYGKVLVSVLETERADEETGFVVMEGSSENGILKGKVVDSEWPVSSTEAGHPFEEGSMVWFPTKAALTLVIDSEKFHVLDINDVLAHK
jgi:co-chaperonin GroES (HSP10)